MRKLTTNCILIQATRSIICVPILWTTQVAPQDTPQVAPHDIDNRLMELIEFCVMPRSKQEMMNYIGLTDSKNFRERYLVPLLEARKIEMTIPDKPNSRNQKYKKVNIEG